MRAADATPGRGDFWILKIAHAPSPENLPKNGFCPLKGVAFLTETVFEKNFQVRERIPLSALAPARRAAAASYLLKLEAAVRAAKEAATTATTSRFVPVTLPAAKAS